MADKPTPSTKATETNNRRQRFALLQDQANFFVHAASIIQGLSQLASEQEAEIERLEISHRESGPG